MYQDLDPTEFKEAYENASDAVLIDVRTPAEIADSSIEGYIAMNIMEPGFAEHVAALDKDKSYYIYCRSGNRSGQACRYMATLGFERLANLRGGIIAWEHIF